MPKIYKYFGIVFLFHARDHQPIHIHGRKRGAESKAEIIIKDGDIVKIRICKVGNKIPLSREDRQRFVIFVEKYAEDIRNKWIMFYVDGITPKMEEIKEV